VRDMPASRLAEKFQFPYCDCCQLADALASAVRREDKQRLADNRSIVNESKLCSAAVKADVAVVAHHKTLAVRNGKWPEVCHPVLCSTVRIFHIWFILFRTIYKNYVVFALIESPPTAMMRLT